MRDLIGRYKRSVSSWISRLPLDQAMAKAVGGEYELVGRIEADLLEKYGLRDGMTVIDLGCGSGRLSTELGRRFPRLNYLGTDVVRSLLRYAAKRAPSSFRFALAPGPKIPADDAVADFVVAFSLFTHLYHEQSFAYLTEAKRVTKPGGRIVFSFIEMDTHWPIFQEAKGWIADRNAPLNMFIERSAVDVWSRKLDLVLEGYEPMGQIAAILRRP